MNDINITHQPTFESPHCMTNQCEQCSSVFTPTHKYTIQRFCNRSCAATYNNLRKPGKQKKLCLVCNKPVRQCNSNCCSAVCRDSLFFTIHTNPRVEAGLVSARTTLRKYLVRARGDGCEMCGVITWLNVKLTLEVDHIDGDATNNFPSNLRLLCSNCHSITPTWKGKNRGNGRKSRGAKSY